MRSLLKQQSENGQNDASFITRAYVDTHREQTMNKSSSFVLLWYDFCFDSTQEARWSVFCLRGRAVLTLGPASFPWAQPSARPAGPGSDTSRLSPTLGAALWTDAQTHLVTGPVAA